MSDLPGVVDGDRECVSTCRECESASSQCLRRSEVKLAASAVASNVHSFPMRRRRPWRLIYGRGRQRRAGRDETWRRFPEGYA